LNWLTVVAKVPAQFPLHREADTGGQRTLDVVFWNKWRKKISGNNLLGSLGKWQIGSRS